MAWTCTNCKGSIQPFEGPQAKCPHCGALLNRPVPTAAPAKSRTKLWLIVGAVAAVVIAVGAIAASHQNAKTNSQVATWCQEHNLGANGSNPGTVPVEESALLELGSPTAKVTHDGAIYLTYGSETLIFNDAGYADESDYISGC